MIAILQMLGRDQIDQKSAQAACWHLGDHLSWQELASKVRVQHLNGSREMYFTPVQIQTAIQIVAEATRRAPGIVLRELEEPEADHHSPSAG